ncbi:hypothetical protein EKH57_02950 [Halorubrum sp. BOL3-1]|uniref:hypothetical protein n=1 Tax=Halorubrum sp. BOL3-1 TaxID=2497325 RepID=UPI001004DF1F|nr:hypothetical protein [Halorubrum sp. BOL3-1]QAU11794.1 hypothetical protein EKH57_02950 [Halorubrum sp. BOL3-1]
MAKVSIGLRGWRFEEDEIFSGDEELKPLDKIPEDPRDRLLRLVSLVEEPCDVCYLEHGEAEVHRCNEAEIVYGEPDGEVLLCPEHEPELLYWFREAGGSDHKGSVEFADRFHEWVAAGNEAPEGYGSVEHVEEDPGGLPDLPDQQEVQERLEADFEGERIDILELAGGDDRDEDAQVTETELADSELDLSADYPANR